MVTRANARTKGIGGHLSTYASSASPYEVGFNDCCCALVKPIGDRRPTDHRLPAASETAFLRRLADLLELPVGDSVSTELSGQLLAHYTAKELSAFGEGQLSGELYAFGRTGPTQDRADVVPQLVLGHRKAR